MCSLRGLSPYTTPDQSSRYNCHRQLSWPYIQNLEAQCNRGQDKPTKLTTRTQSITSNSTLKKYIKNRRVAPLALDGCEFDFSLDRQPEVAVVNPDDVSKILKTSIFTSKYGSTKLGLGSIEGQVKPKGDQ
ncbi:MAG: hypothetical protein ACI845_002500 [Gammaproteobacteria bacterium]|jgi:hypothetical protein